MEYEIFGYNRFTIVRSYHRVITVSASGNIGISRSATSRGRIARIAKSLGGEFSKIGKVRTCVKFINRVVQAKRKLCVRCRGDQKSLFPRTIKGLLMQVACIQDIRDMDLVYIEVIQISSQQDVIILVTHPFAIVYDDVQSIVGCGHCIRKELRRHHIYVVQGIDKGRG